MRIWKAIWWTTTAPLHFTRVIATDVVAPIYKGLSEVKWFNDPPPHNAKFATRRDLKAGGYLEPDGTLVGRQGRENVYLDRERSAIVFGQPGLGKTSMGIANVLNMKGTPHILAMDPAGDFKRGVLKALVTRGYEVITVDLANPLESHRYGAFSEISQRDEFVFTRGVKAICTLLVPDGARESDTGVHFKESAKNMLRSLVVWRLLKPELGASLGQIVDRLLVEKTARTNEFESMRSHPNRLIRQGVEVYLSAGNKEQGSMDSTLGRKLEAYLDDAVMHVSNGGEFSFTEKLKQKKPVAIFIKMGLTGKESGGAFARLMVGNCCNAIRQMYDEGEKCENGLFVYLDEPYLLGNCQPIIDCVVELRKGGVKVVANFPDYDTVFDTFHEAQRLINNCAWVISGGSQDLKLYEAACKLAGKRKVVSKSVSKGQSESETEYSTWEDLLTVGECQALQPDDVLVVARGFIWKGKKPYTLVDGKPVF